MRYLHFIARLPLIFVAVFLLAQTTLYGQKLSVGVIGGAALTDLMDEVTGGSSEAKRYTVGPLLEIRLSESFAAEISALYRRTGYTSAFSVIGLTISRVRADSWEFPLLLKYYVARQRVVARPYISGGYVLRYLSNPHQTEYLVTLPGLPPYTTYYDEYRFHSNPSQGLAIGGGLSFKAWRIHIAPGVRYTRWLTLPFDEYGSHGFTVQSARNQVDLLVGVSF